MCKYVKRAVISVGVESRNRRTAAPVALYLGPHLPMRVCYRFVLGEFPACEAYTCFLHALFWLCTLGRRETWMSLSLIGLVGSLVP